MNRLAAKKAQTVNHDQLVLLVLLADREIRSFNICEMMTALTGDRFPISWVVYSMHALEHMGYVASRLDGATPERGGNRDRFYSVTDKWKEQIDAVMGEFSVVKK